MPDEQELRRQRIRDAMRASISAPVSTTTVNPNASTPNLDPTRTVTPMVTMPPQPSEVNTASLAGLERPNEPTTPIVTPSRLHYSTAGLTGVDKLIEQRKQLEGADPESDVRITPQGVDVDAPRMKGVNGRSRWKPIGEGVLTGLAMADPENPNAILGSAIGGGTLGAVNPRGEAQLKRRFDLNVADNDIARGLKLEQEKAQLGDINAQAEQRLRPQIFAPHVEVDSDGNVMSIQGGVATPVRDAAGNQVKAPPKTGPRARFEWRTDEDGREHLFNTDTNEEVPGAVNTSKRLIKTPTGLMAPAAAAAAGMRGQETPAALGERTRKAEAAKAEVEQLTRDEATAGEEKNKAYKALEDIKKTAPNDARGDMLIREAEQAAETANKLYQSYTDKKAEAQRKITENSGPTTEAPKKQGQYIGQRISASKIGEVAKRLNLSEAKARQYLIDEGAEIY